MDVRRSPNPSGNIRLLSIRDAADIVGYSPDHLRRKLKQQGFPVYKFGPKGHCRINFSDLESYMKNQELTGPVTNNSSASGNV